MSNLENLTSKIIKDAEIKANAILDEARKEERRIIDDKTKDAEQKKNEIINKAHLEGKSRKERVISNAHLFIRNRKLEAKGEIINKIYKEALDKLNKLPKEVYLNFIRQSLLSLNIDGDEELILSSNDKYIQKEFLDEINEELKKKGKKGEINISSERRDFVGGFILFKNGIEINNTFEALIFSLRDELEPRIINTVFS
ncbi:V-type ATP synthase subunit E [Clostridium tetanomorphum]|uniref:V-type proton ATPase subunit E n=2 Tax=Clostridium TaxID=1485 RepID=A0A923E9X6_CLOTT|nr:V-type ATP synthase subunit E family protein [Clostridium tetanomorphum]MBC2396498.1 V-type ATP synthase subunit E [Clostridium tetanomorphum]NRZ98116.1 V/A-type H+-transporting ATPase subunit E [Clostridium tetanomorphum]